MAQHFVEQMLQTCWAKEQPLRLNGIAYRVGRMSYGQYFLEPGITGGERAPFNQGTIWIVKQGKDFVAEA